MTKRSLYLGVTLLLTVMFAGALRADAPEAPKPRPVAVMAAIGCFGKFSVWVLRSDGKVAAIDEHSGMTLQQLSVALEGVPAQVRHFDDICPIRT